MALLQIPQLSKFGSSSISSTSSPWREGRSPRLSSHSMSWRDSRRRTLLAAAVIEASYSPDYKMNLNEYMVTLERPLGFDLRFHSREKYSSTRSRKGQMLKDVGVSRSMVLERPFSPYPIQQLHLNSENPILFNKGKVPFATWNGTVLASNLQPSGRQINSGFAIFCPKFLNHQGWMLLLSQGRNDGSGYEVKNNTEVVGICSEENSGDIGWSHGSFPLEEYVKALERSKGELYYNHSLGMQYSKITEQIYVGSCIQSESDVQKLSTMGITAVLNFQSESEHSNWGINSQAINESCHNLNILMVNYPIRMVDSLELRKKLPFSVGLLLRLLRKSHRIFVMCTTGFDTSPACVIAYLHWIQDTALNAAHNFVTGLHSCRPDRSAIVWATWDLIAMAENGKSDGSPTHVVNFMWSNGCREGEEVFLVGSFTGNWKEPIKMVHKRGPIYEAKVRLRHGKYKYKFIVGGQWRHSTSLPTERDERGLVNNVIRIGDVASIRPSPRELHIKDPTVVMVLERHLTEDERFFLAFAARRIALAVCPLKLAPK